MLIGKTVFGYKYNYNANTLRWDIDRQLLNQLRRLSKTLSSARSPNECIASYDKQGMGFSSYRSISGLRVALNDTLCNTSPPVSTEATRQKKHNYFLHLPFYQWNVSRKSRFLNIPSPFERNFLACLWVQPSSWRFCISLGLLLLKTFDFYVQWRRKVFHQTASERNEPFIHVRIRG